MGRRVSLGRVLWVWLLSVALTASTGVFVPAAAVGKPGGASAKSSDRSVPVTAAKPRKGKLPVAPPRATAVKPVWPQRATARIGLERVSGGGRRGQAVVGGLPITVIADATTQMPTGRMSSSLTDTGGGPAAVTVEVVDSSVLAGTGAVVGVQVVAAEGQPGDLPVRVQIGYGAFADAFGAGWSERLGVVRLPDCVLSSPEVADCRVVTRQPSTNDTSADVVSAQVDLNAVSVVDAAVAVDGQSSRSSRLTGQPAGQTVGVTDAADGSVVVALAASAASQNGDFAKTSLSQTGSWQAGGSSGDFSWSYPISVPPVPGGLTPPITIGYSSASVDGKTANENAQASWIGEGFDYQPGFIERSYRSCGSDTEPAAPTWADTTDSCWRMANATLSWGGRSTELIANDASNPPNTAMPAVWHLADDDATKVEYFAGGDGEITQNWGDERWRLTTKDGVQYWFGKSIVPGSRLRTNSVFGMPVVSNHPGEPCYSGSALSASWCSMAYRWNLDYVVDAHGNSMVYTYAKESNSAHKPGFATATQTYDRAGYLMRIEYGWRAGLESADAPVRVLFDTAERCWTSSCGTHDGSNWPETPWDLYCGSGGPCEGPTFFTTRRLVTVTTQVWNGSSGSYRNVDVYTLDSTVFATGHAGGGKALNLQSIAHTGADSGTGVTGSAIGLAPTYFGYGDSMQNRALFDPNSGAPDAWKYRLRAITTESGAQVDITYQSPDGGCVYPATAPSPDMNYRRCMPQYYSGDGGGSSGWTWWHKYIVASVTESDGTGTSTAPMVHSYTYLTSASVDGRTIGTSSVLWAHDRNAYGSAGEFRSWNRWVGYPLVTTTVGTGGYAPNVSKSMSVYFTGLDGDSIDNGVRDVELADTEGVGEPDYGYRAGMIRETITFDGNTATVLAKTITDNSAIQTGARTIDSSWATNFVGKAWLAHSTAERSFTKLAASGMWRQTRTVWTHDTYGNVTKTDAQGDIATGADDTCTTNTYLANPASNLRRYNGTGPSAITNRPAVLSSDWNSYDITIAAGDFNGDGKNDMIGRRWSQGTLVLIPGNGVGGFGASVVIGSGGWNGFLSLVATDVTGDGKPDIIGNGPDGTLQRYTNTGGAITPTGTQIGASGWQDYRLFAPGDFSGDAKPDLLGVNPSTGSLWLWTGTGTGTINAGTQLATSGWDQYQQVFGNGDITGDAKTDLLAADTAGIWIYPGTGASGFDPRYRLASGLIGADADQWLAPGDITGDGRFDILTRQSHYLAGIPSESITVGVNCATTPNYSTDVVARTQQFIDQPGVASPMLAATPIVGDVTKVEAADSYPSGSAHWVTQSQTVYDDYGRPTSVKDPLGNTTTTAYTQTHGLTTQVKVTDRLGYATTTTLAVGRGLPVTVTDPNNKTTTGSYDALGRLRKVWRPGHPVNDTPDAEYAYNVNGVNSPPYVTTKVMGPETGQIITSYEILDGLLRTRQTQTPTADGKRTITDTAYDGRGLVWKTASFYNNAGAPSSTRVAYADADLDSQTRYTYDGLARQATSELWSHNAKVWNTTATSYDGDRTTIDTNYGGTDTTTIVDAFGRTTELRQYTGSAANGNYTKTLYGYDHAGNLSSVTGPDGAVWTYTYDLLGRKTATADPDAGTSSTSYDDAGRITSTTDGRGQVLSYSYDNLGRKIAVYKTTTKTAANQLAGWVYDSVAKGQLTSSTRYIGGSQVGAKEYTRTVTGYDNGYRPTHTDLTVADSGPLSGTYGIDYTYKTNGLPATQTAAAVGGLPGETLTFAYNSIGQPTGLSSGTQTYIASAAYNFDGQIAEQILGTSTTQVRHSYGYEAATRRLTLSKVETGTTGAWTEKALDDYHYDQAGNLTAIAGTTNAAYDQTECFTYDYLRRLTTAYTEYSYPCDLGPGLSSGADPYRLQWTFDDTAPVNGVIKTAGLRTTETAYNTDGTTIYQSTYTYGGSGKPAHSLAAVTTTGTGAATKTYNYDAAGNTTSRPGPGGAQQTLTWDEEGHLAKVSDSADTTYVYDADGNRIIRNDPGGYSTLTLTDGTELRANTSGPVLGTRYYGGVATRTANTDSAGKYTTSTLTWNMTDHHGTGTIAINPATLQVDRRRSLPYGGPRGTQATGFGNKGFVGGTTDPTGLTHLGAREYDPFLGRFLSVDPMFDGTDPQSWNGYAYADNSPITLSDPTGLIADDFEGCFACQQDPTGQKARDYESPTAKRVKRDQEFKRKRQGLNRLVDLVPDGEADLEKLSDFLNGDYRAPAMDIANNLLFGSDGDVAPPFGRDEFTDRAMILQGCLKVAMACTENYIQDLTLSCRCQITQIEESGVGGRTLARLLRGASLDRGAFAKQVAEDIGNGHAFDKHFLRKGEFPELRTRFQFKAAIEEVITKGKYRDLSNGRQGFWYNGTVVIRNPNAIDGGTAFKAGKEYFQGLR